MSLPFFYETGISFPHHILSEETAKHCINVLRMKKDDAMNLTDGKGNLYTATIIHANKKYCEVNIEQSKTLSNLSTTNVSIAISILKNPTRFEWFIEKATEIGVYSIIPLLCDHTEKENFRYERMKNIVISAMLQSQQTWLPQLHQPKKFNTLIHEEFDGLKLIAHCAEEEKKPLSEVINQQKNKLILIGPEGDFSQLEINNALQKNFIPVTLGKTRLRSETAGIVAAAILCNTHS